MRCLFLITARGGSKGIPGKNIKLLGGKPLISYTIAAAKGVGMLEDICISTDSPEIMKVAESLGLKMHFQRPPELATDTASSESVIVHALDFFSSRGIEYDVVVLLQPTSPFRTSKHIKEAIALFRDDLDMVVSVKETKANPYYLLVEENADGFLVKSKEGNFTRRQDCPTVYEYNGAVYVINVRQLRLKGFAGFTKRVKYLMDEYESIDIDNELDWIVAEACLRRNA
jgi:CMP-N,N'-diacetyllegionaminic acid synthase